MLVLSKGGLSAKQAEQYYREKYGRDDYYSEEKTIPGYWYGEGAARLGLRGEVREEAFHAVLYGQHPRTGDVLVEAGPQGDRRAGWDATFNAPKSVSIQALVGGDTRLLAAHRDATDRALREFERFVQTRQHRGQEWVTTGNMVAARFDHVAARPSQRGMDQGYGADPHLHTHVVVANLTQRGDGAWRALDPLELYRSQEHATAVYRATLAQSVQRLGYEITVTGQRGEWELAGYSREQILAFSQRRQDIEQHLAERSLTGAAAAQIAAHQTRLSKDGRDDHSLRAEWQERAQGVGLDLSQIAALARERRPIEHSRAVQHETAATAVTYAREHHTERQAVIDVRAVEATALQRGMGTIDVEQVRDAITAQQTQGAMIRVQIARFPQGGFTTQEMLALERENLNMLDHGTGQAQPLAHAADVQAWAQKLTITHKSEVCTSGTRR